MSFIEKWNAAVRQKDSILCAGLDPAEFEQRPSSTLPQGTNKLEWCKSFIKKIAPYASAVKINRNYIKELSRSDLIELNNLIHSLGMVSIDDSKLADIGSTNESGFYQAYREGFDGVTYSPYAGNIKEATDQAHEFGLGIISVILMSNPEFEVVKTAQINGQPLYLELAKKSVEANVDGIVIGAPSNRNHIKTSEIEALYGLLKDQLILLPGMGAQGGEGGYLLETFGSRVIANVGRSILYSENPAKESQNYRSMFNTTLNANPPLLQKAKF